MKTTSSGLGDIGKEPTLESTVYENTVSQINETLKNDEPKNTFYVEVCSHFRTQKRTPR